MSYPRYVGLGRRRRWTGYVGMGLPRPTTATTPIMPTAGAKAAADAWVRSNPGYGTQTLTPWLLEADGSTVTAPTDSPEWVRYGFGRGVLAAFPPALGIASGGPVAVQPPVLPQDQQPITTQVVAPVMDSATSALIQGSQGATVVPVYVPGEPQPSAPSMPVEPAPAAATGAGVSPLVLVAAAVVAGYFLLIRKRR
jgi:hypothetical protein